MTLLSCQIMITAGKSSDSLHLVEEVGNREQQAGITQVQLQEEECTDCQRLTKEVIKTSATIKECVARLSWYDFKTMKELKITENLFI